MTELVTRTDLNAAVECMTLRVDLLETEFDSLRHEVDIEIDRLSLQLTVRLGALMAAGIGVLAVLVHLH